MIVRVPQIRSEILDYAEARDDDAGDVLGCVGDLFHRGRDLENAGHVLRVLRTARCEDRNPAKSAQVFDHPVLEATHLLGEVYVGEEDCRVGEIDHQLRGVLDLSKEPLDGIRTL